MFNSFSKKNIGMPENPKELDVSIFLAFIGELLKIIRYISRRFILNRVSSKILKEKRKIFFNSSMFNFF
jgi:hypothetical protein